MHASSLLVLEALLPEANKGAERQIKANHQRRESEADQCVALKAELASTIAAIRSAGAGMIFANAGLELSANLDAYLDLIARIRASGRSDSSWQELRKSAIRNEAKLNQLRLLVDALAVHRSENAGWLSQQVLIFFGLAIILLPIFFDARIVYLLIAAAAAIAAWRLAPVISMRRKIRDLAARL